jgi:hypothetical protein
MVVAIRLPLITIAYLTNLSPSKLGDELMLKEFCVHEAVSVSEIMYLCEHYPIDVVMIAHDVETFGEIQQKQITMKLKPIATVGEIVWELTNLFPGRQISVQ